MGASRGNRHYGTGLILVNPYQLWGLRLPDSFCLVSWNRRSFNWLHLWKNGRLMMYDVQIMGGLMNIRKL